MSRQVKAAKNSQGSGSRSPRPAQGSKELDVLVAEKVMQQVPCDGWSRMNFGSAGGAALRKKCQHEDGRCYPMASISNMQGNYDGVPPYSRRIETAEQVIQKMRERGFGWHAHCEGKGWELQCWRLADGPAHAKTITGYLYPAAICHAALAAVQAQMDLETTT